MFYQAYPGGCLTGLYYLWPNITFGIDALGPRDTISFAVSALHRSAPPEPLHSYLQVAAHG